MVSTKSCVIAFAIPLVLLVGTRLFLKSSAHARMSIAVGLMGWDGVGELARETFASRWLGQKQTASRTEFLGLLDALMEADEKYLSPTGRAVVAPDDIAEGHVYLTHLLRTGFETNMENDASRPEFAKLVSKDRKILGDNPDAFYYCANVDKSLAYIVTGRVTHEDYFSLTIYTAPCEGCFFKNTIADVNNKGGFKIGSNGEYKVLVSATPPPSDWDGDWMSMADATNLKEYPEGTALQLVTRHYYERPLSVAADPTMEGTVKINIALANPQTGTAYPSPPAPVLTDEIVARKMRAVKMFVKKHSTELEQDPTKAPKWFSFTLNKFGDPAVFRDVNTGGVGAVDIAYSAAPFKLADDEALVIEGVMPECAFANVVLWNRYLQTFNYIERQTSLNRVKMTSIKDGRVGAFKIVLSHQQPDVSKGYDWLDTMGRNGGTIFWRFLLPVGDVQRPTTRVVKFHDL
jgi:hypothetical protein